MNIRDIYDQNDEVRLSLITPAGSCFPPAFYLSVPDGDANSQCIFCKGGMNLAAVLEGLINTCLYHGATPELIVQIVKESLKGALEGTNDGTH